MITAADRIEHLERFLAGVPGAARRAAAWAMNRALDEARAAAVAKITSRYAVRAGDVAAMITTSRATEAEPSIVVRSRSGSLSLGYFPHTPTSPGTGGPGRPLLRAEVLRGAPRDVPGAFVANLQSGPRVMHRTGGTTSRGKAAIATVYTVPLGSMLGVQSVREAVEAEALAALDRQIGPAIDRELKRAETAGGAS